jgi:tRNA(adenine34) deaminase
MQRLLSDFFPAPPGEARMTASPLRDDALRTPDARFADLPATPGRRTTCSDLPALAGLRCITWTKARAMRR